MFAAGNQLLTPTGGACLIPYDAVGAGNHAVLTSAGITDAITIGASATALLVGISSFITSDTYASVTANSCLLGSTAMSLLDHVNNNNGASGWCEVWGLTFTAGTFTGAQTVTFKEVATSTFPHTYINAVSYQNVASFGTAVTTFGNSAAASTGLVASPPGDRVFAAMAGGFSGALTLSGGGTQHWNSGANTGYVGLLLQDIPGNTTNQLAATLTSGPWGSVAVNMVHI